ncbi:Protein of unknown function [Cotesia congregata]|uniref:Uncharacterized protein n=1 Tax=Cotesia congregata TaxID=51543 RepID=A0A8J2MMT1_COTCN|nr:Protein of unknown function [Cotesia congregata]
MSRTAKRPRGGNSWKASTQRGLLGTRFTIAASPDLMAFGFSSVVFPVRRSHFSLISANLQAIDVTTTQFLDRDVLNVETNVVSGDGLSEGFVMHFYGLNFSGKSSGGESNNHTWFQQTSFDTTDWYCSNTSNLRFVGGSAWWQDSVKSFNEGGTFTVTVFTFNLPSLEPSHFAGCLQHVVSVPSRDGDESNSGWVVTNLLDGSEFQHRARSRHLIDRSSVEI